MISQRREGNKGSGAVLNRRAPTAPQKESPASYKLPEGCPMALLLRRTTMMALLRRGSTWSRSTEPVPPAFLTSLDNPQTYFDSSELRAVGGLETQPQPLNAETEKVLHDEAWRGVAKKRGLMLESLVDAEVAAHGAFAPAAVMRSRHP